MNTLRSLRLLGLVSGLFALVTQASAQDTGFTFAPQSASTVAPRIDLLFNVLLGISALIAGVICLLIIVFGFKYRRGSRADRSHAPSQNLKLELTWIIIPILISIPIFVWAARIYFDMYQPPPDAMTVYVVGKQWMWKLQHPEGQREINELHVPVGRPVKLILSSQDVIHSFFVPALRIKQDVVPGRYSETWFQATKPGRYHLFCAQYCGTDHASMQGWVYVQSLADYQAWLRSGSPQESMIAEGGKLYEQLGCSGCHGNGNIVRAPSLAGLYGSPVPLKSHEIVTADDRYLHASIVSPSAQIVAGYEDVMPSYKDRVSEEQILQIIAYIRSLGPTPVIETRPSPTQEQNRVRQQRQSIPERLQQIQPTKGGVKP